jgi:hypothetical protein
MEDEEGLIIWHDITATNGVTVTAFSLVIFNFGLRNSICSVPSSLRSSICPEHHRRNMTLSTTRFVFPYMTLEILACISLATKPSLLLDPCPTQESPTAVAVRYHCQYRYIDQSKCLEYNPLHRLGIYVTLRTFEDPLNAQVLACQNVCFATHPKLPHHRTCPKAEQSSFRTQVRCIVESSMAPKTHPRRTTLPLVPTIY